MLVFWHKKEFGGVFVNFSKIRGHPKIFVIPSQKIQEIERKIVSQDQYIIATFEDIDPKATHSVNF